MRNTVSRPNSKVVRREEGGAVCRRSANNVSDYIKNDLVFVLLCSIVYSHIFVLAFG